MKPKQRTISFFGCLLFLSGLFAVTIAAQKAETVPAPQMYEIAVVTVKPEMQRDFEELIKSEYNPGFTKGGGTSSIVWQMEIGNYFEYVFVQPFKDFASMDSPSTLMKGLGNEGTQALYSKLSKTITGVTSQIIQARPDLSYFAEVAVVPKAAVVVYVTVGAGKTEGFEKFITDEYLPVVRRSGVQGFWVMKVMFGGNTNEYTIVQPQLNFAEMDKGPVPARVLKADEVAALMKKMPEGTVVNIEVYVSRFNPELSVNPPATEKK